MNHYFVIGILLVLFSIVVCSTDMYPKHIVYAHNFSITDDSELITLIERIKAETELVNAYLVSSNNVSAIEHAKNAANLTNDLNDKLRQSAVGGDITQVYTNGLYNSSTLALVVANLVDEILRSYGSAYGITYDLTNMSNMMSNSDGSLSRLDVTNETGNNTMSSHGGHTSVSEINNDVLVNMYRYQTAQLLSNVVNRLFSDKLSAQAPVNENITIGILEQSIKDLKYAIDNKVHAKALMEIVHMKIHPMLQSAYNLKLVVR